MMKVQDFSERVLRSSRLRLGLVAGLLAMSGLFALPASATIMQYLEVEELTRLSSDIFHGQVISVTTAWNAEQTRIYTKIRLRINETFKGQTRRSEVVTITQLGGEVDGVKMDYAGRPEFAVGETAALFTIRGRNNDFIVVGLKQGKLRVEGAGVVRDFSGITLIDRGSRGTNQQPLSNRPIRLSLTDLRNRIQRTR